MMYQGKLPLRVKLQIAFQQFRKWVVTPFGILTTIYMLNVIAWGGMLFLLLCNAAPAMCHPSCSDIESPRRKWIEVDSQILNALFCVTGFGLAPIRFRDLYWWTIWRFARSEESRSRAIRRLAGIHNNWYRLPSRGGSLNRMSAQPYKSENSDPQAASLELTAAAYDSNSLQESGNDDIPIPASKAPSPPITGIRASATAPWKMTFVVHCMVWNTIFQACLSGCMWGFNRYNRPSYTVGLFLGLAFVAVGLSGWVMMKESGRIKKIEGKPMSLEEKRARVALGARHAHEETQPLQNL